MHKVGIVGAGFVGTACEIGFQHVAEINIYDKFKDTEPLQFVVDKSDILFICVPTPTDFETGKCDTSIVESVIQEIHEIADSPKCIVIKSTVPPKTTEKLQEKYDKHVFVFNPEFLTERNFIDDFKNQNRIILGCKYGRTNKDSPYRKLTSLYASFIAKQNQNSGIYFTKIIECTPDEAEMLKYISNTFLATKVAFFNEMFEICKASEIEYDNVTAMLGYDDRIGLGHTQVPGSDGQFGFSGKCFPKDLNALMFFAKENGVDPLIMESVWAKNLLIRDKHDWESIPGATTENMNFGDKKE